MPVSREVLVEKLIEMSQRMHAMTAEMARVKEEAAKAVRAEKEAAVAALSAAREVAAAAVREEKKAGEAAVQAEREAAASAIFAASAETKQAIEKKESEKQLINLLQESWARERESWEREREFWAKQEKEWMNLEERGRYHVHILREALGQAEQLRERGNQVTIQYQMAKKEDWNEDPDLNYELPWSRTRPPPWV